MIQKHFCYTPNWPEQAFVVNKTVPWTCVITDLNDEEIIVKCYEKGFAKNKSLQI